MKNLFGFLTKKNKNTVKCITVMGRDRDIGKNLLSIKTCKDESPFIKEYFSKINGLNTFERIEYSNSLAKITNSRKEYAQFQCSCLQREEYQDFSAKRARF